MNSEIQESDKLRSPDRVHEPDSRTHLFVNLDRRTGLVSPRIIEDQFRVISGFMLNDNVPKDVLIHFETAKNLYLYAWFVYRFYPIAEQQALASLEFALRERFPDFVAAEKKKHKRSWEPGLKQLLGYAIKEGFVKNENFSTRERWARTHAERRYRNEKREEMRKAGINSWEIDPSKATVTQEDLDFDRLQIFLEIVPTIRNDYAHGSATLKNDVLNSFEFVSEIINQIYPKTA